MPANKYALLRYRIIDKCIRNKYRPYPSKEDLRQACEDALYNSLDERISDSTIEKDLFAMRNEEGLGYMAPIKYSRELNGYFYTDPEYSINDIPLNEEDIDAIKFAALTLSQFKSISVFSHLGYWTFGRQLFLQKSIKVQKLMHIDQILIWTYKN